MKQLFMVLILFSSGAFAGDKVGNGKGGGLWSCFPPGAKVATQTMLVDFYEARIQHKWTIPSAPANTDPWQYAEQTLQQVKQDFPGYANEWEIAYQEVKTRWNLVSAELTPVHDVENYLKPLPETCEGEWRYVQFANFNDRGQLLVSEPLWNMAILPTEDKTGLIWHETIYYWLRTKYQDEDSRRAREINGLIFSTEPAAVKLVKLLELIKGSVTKPSGAWFCKLQNQHTLEFFAGRGRVKSEAISTAQMACQAGNEPFFCTQRTPDCAEAPSDKIAWICSLKENQNFEVFSGEGRTKVEAGFVAQDNCQKSRRSEFCADAQLSCEPLP